MGTTPFDFCLTSDDLLSLSGHLREALTLVPYTPPASDPVSIKSFLLSLLPSPSSADPRGAALHLCLCCAAVASSEGEDSPRVFWVTEELRSVARAVVAGLAGLLGVEEREVVEGVMWEVVPVLKGVIRESCVDVDAEDGGKVAAKPSVAHAVVAGLQFRWFVTEVHYPRLGKLCSLVVPCALTALDHWSPEVKDQGMLAFIHIAKNVASTELGCYEDPILDACCNNIASSDELWPRVIEMTVLLLTSMLRENPRSPWFLNGLKR